MGTVGLVVSGTIVFLSAGNVIMFFILWGLYQSLSNVGQRWYSFGWESQLLEMGFLAMFLSPVLSLSQFSRHTPTSWTNVWGNCWMIFRIIIGACLIKMRGDTCWRDLTCMNYHYEIPAEQGHTYASEVNAIFAETSALTARNVEEMFIEITHRLIHHVLREDAVEGTKDHHNTV
ncbi:PREDICTED: lipase maturation factor 1-like isoform X5 [Amphimedon queenslandica]|uniref:Lipase maturation factor n=1 Tax=Amphimedon queenslandica TaxID=400682 RepID=A0AAN0JT23_AMPQE|nr:PREDICTED: lipase maturation factor 1-like isoform X5 [Amphimedon queenslandica]XP_019860045.1 PREDICTED: lipase maturation factor 1-like isoform X5 [Amphimedon queenslandica]|eukprot:XP_019860044.1 PREDICTED: lipase maturation factor 1-like isoform X5 [Amphimedon queenslandica]